MAVGCHCVCLCKLTGASVAVQARWAHQTICRSSLRKPCGALSTLKDLPQLAQHAGGPERPERGRDSRPAQAASPSPSRAARTARAPTAPPWTSGGLPTRQSPDDAHVEGPMRLERALTTPTDLSLTRRFHVLSGASPSRATDAARPWMPVAPPQTGAGASSGRQRSARMQPTTAPCCCCQAIKVGRDLSRADLCPGPLWCLAGASDVTGPMQAQGQQGHCSARPCSCRSCCAACAMSLPASRC